MTIPLFLEDAYSSTVEARLMRIVPPSSAQSGTGLVFDRTNFFPQNAEQPGDTGFVETAEGERIPILATAGAEDGEAILMWTGAHAPLPAPGDQLVLHLDWRRRYRLMRMHTACHLLAAICPYPVLGAQLGEDESRVDVDCADAVLDRQELTVALAALVEAAHPVFSRSIKADELAADVGFDASRTLPVPAGPECIRLVCIGEDGSIDSRPCGGTHVLDTHEIGDVHVGAIEKMGNANRLHLRFGPVPQ